MNQCTKCESPIPSARTSCAVCGAPVPVEWAEIPTEVEETPGPTVPQKPKAKHSFGPPVHSSKAVSPALRAATSNATKAVSAASSRVERFAITGRSSHHTAMMAGFAAVGMGVLSVGAGIGWQSANTPHNAPLEIAYTDELDLASTGSPVPEELARALVSVTGADCGGDWVREGFVTRGVVVVPDVTKNTRSTVTIGGSGAASDIIGENAENDALIVVPVPTRGDGLELGVASSAVKGTVLYQLSGSNSPRITRAVVNEVSLAYDGRLTLSFDPGTALVAGSPVIDHDRRVIAIVNPEADLAVGIAPIDSSISAAKLHPFSMIDACPEATPAADN